MTKTCDVCGKPSGMYPLCKDCFKLKDEGKVIKCEKCGKWHLTEKPCCEFKQKNNNATTTITAGKCLICNNSSEANNIFCKTCYHKYKNKIVLLQIKNCTDIELLDESYEGKYICKDGIYRTLGS